MHKSAILLSSTIFCGFISTVSPVLDCLALTVCFIQICNDLRSLWAIWMSFVRSFGKFANLCENWTPAKFLGVLWHSPRSSSVTSTTTSSEFHTWKLARTDLPLLAIQYHQIQVEIFTKAIYMMHINLKPKSECIFDFEFMLLYIYYDFKHLLH